MAEMRWGVGSTEYLWSPSVQLQRNEKFFALSPEEDAVRAEEKCMGCRRLDRLCLRILRNINRSNCGRMHVDAYCGTPLTVRFGEDIWAYARCHQMRSFDE